MTTKPNQTSRGEDQNTPDEIKRIQFYLRKELDKWDRTELDLKNGGVADFMAIDHILEVLPPVVQALITAARIDGMKQAQSRVLRRTEIPKDAREPTRDYVVILGEEIADIIERDIATLTNDKIEGEHGGL